MEREEGEEEEGEEEEGEGQTEGEEDGEGQTEGKEENQSPSVPPSSASPPVGFDSPAPSAPSSVAADSVAADSPYALHRHIRTPLADSDSANGVLSLRVEMATLLWDEERLLCRAFRAPAPGWWWWWWCRRSARRRKPQPPRLFCGDGSLAVG